MEPDQPDGLELNCWIVYVNIKINDSFDPLPNCSPQCTSARGATRPWLESPSFTYMWKYENQYKIVKLRQGSDKVRQGKARKGKDGERWKALKLKPLPWAYIKVGCQSWIVRQSVNSSTQRGVPGARSRLPRLPGAKLSISYNSVLSLKNRYERVSSSSNLKQRIDMRGYLAAAARKKKFLHRNCPRQFVKAIPQHPPPPPNTAPSNIRNQLSSAVSWNISRAVSFSSH